mgnify:CR=1 FL=1
MKNALKVLVTLQLFTSIQSASASEHYVFPISGCKYSYAHSHHNYPATDILTNIGCNFVAPTSGVVDEINRVDRFSWKTNLGADRGGLFISIIGSDGVRYYGSHLSAIAPNLNPGDSVTAGELLGKTGNSGDAKGTAPHLHFGISWPTPKNIWWVRRGELYPWKYLDAWRTGKDANPYKSVKALEKIIGTVPRQVGY